jgi:hypothetical protein
MLKGYELGLGHATAFEFIHVIQGKPSVSPKGALALIHQSSRLAGMKIEDIDKDGKPFACKVWMKRSNGFEYSIQFTMDDAARAGLVKGDSGWEKYPANMLRWRAIGYVADIVFPDVIGGMGRPEELGATVDADGEPLAIEGTFTPVASQPIATRPIPPVSDIPTTAIELVQLGFDAAAILAAAAEVTGIEALPQTPEDVAKVYAKLTTVDNA